MNPRDGPGGTTWFCIRRDGAARRDGWIGCDSLTDLRRRVGARSDEVVEVSMAGEFRRVKRRRLARVFYPRARGIVGMEIAFRGEVVRLAPTRMIAANLGFDRALARFLEERDASAGEFAAGGELRAFSAEQYLLPLGNESRPVELFRGSTLVDADSTNDEDRAAVLADGIGRWMRDNLSADGALPYKYWPSRGEESPADNAIRRFLASSALARLGELRGSAELREAARRNLRYNLDRYFQDIGGGRGAIVETTGGKLGAAAVAGLAILESPARDEFARELTMLAAGIDSLADDELGFRTFFFPAERDGENWNFYSGRSAAVLGRGSSKGAPDRAATRSMRGCVRTLSRTAPPEAKSRLRAVAYPGLCVALRADTASEVRGLRLRDERLAAADAAMGRARSGSPGQVLRSAPTRVRPAARGLDRGVPRRALGRGRARESPRRTRSGDGLWARHPPRAAVAQAVAVSGRPRHVLHLAQEAGARRASHRGIRQCGSRGFRRACARSGEQGPQAIGLRVAGVRGWGMRRLVAGHGIHDPEPGGHRR